jgi:predicted PurR-regulated permease PerM
MSSDRYTTVNITNRTMIRAILWVVAAIAVFRFIGEISQVLTIIFVSIFLALALNPIVSWMSRRLRIRSRGRATAAAYLTVVALIAGFFALITPPLISETRDFVQDVPRIVQDFQTRDTSLSRLVNRYNLNDQLSEAAGNFSTRYGDFGGAILQAGKRVFSVVVSMLAVLVLTFMMLVEGPRWLKLIWGVSPDQNRARHQEMAHKMYKAVTGFVNGQVIMAAAGGFATFVALLIASRILDVTVNAVALAGIVAVFSLIPIFGTIIAAAIVVLFCALNSVTLGLVMLIYYIVYQQIENLSLQPYIQSKVTQLTPMTVFVAALIGVGFGGLLGAIVAIPAAGALKILLEDYFERRGKKAPTASA